MAQNSFLIQSIKSVLGEIKIPVESLFPENQALIAKTGIPNVFKTDQNIVDFASKPLKDLIGETKIVPDCIIVVTQSHEFYLPGLSSFILDKLKLSESIYCLDINQGCSGFAHAVFIADKLLSTFNNIAIVCADKYRSKLNPNDRSTNAVFSDCATATLVSNCDSGLVVKEAKYKFDGAKWEYLYQTQNNILNSGFLHMSGAELWGYTRSSILPEIKKFTDEGVIDNLYIHQASKLVCDGITSSIHNSVKNIPHNYELIGNTVSSSIPMLISNQLDKVNGGSSLIAGFGVGLNAMLLKLEKII